MGMELQQDEASHGLTEEDIIHIPGLYSRWVRLADGRMAHYVTSGETGPAVILLHGSIEGSSGTAGWRFMAPFLGAHGFRVYAPDRPGFGLSDTSNPKYLEQGAFAQVEFVKMFADALGIEKFHLSGNSGGCTISTNVVISHPHRVLSVAFIAGGIGDINDKPRVAPTEGRFTPNPAYKRDPFDGSEKSMHDLMAGIIYEPGAIWPELVTMRTLAARRQREARGVPVDTAAEVVRDLGAREASDPHVQQLYTTKNRLDRLQIPMIYLYGLQDVLSPVENGFNQEDVAPNIQFFYPNHCGHQGQTDQPGMFNQVFLEFFRDGKVSAKTAEWANVSRRRPINPNVVEGPLPEPDPNWLEQFTREAMAAAKA